MAVQSAQNHCCARTALSKSFFGNQWQAPDTGSAHSNIHQSFHLPTRQRKVNRSSPITSAFDALQAALQIRFVQRMQNRRTSDQVAGRLKSNEPHLQTRPPVCSKCSQESQRRRGHSHRAEGSRGGSSKSLDSNMRSERVSRRSATQSLAGIALAIVLGSQEAPRTGDTFENVPRSLSSGGDEAPRKRMKPKSAESETCARKCVSTCVRGGGGGPGTDGPLNVRKPLVVFKEGFRSRQYWCPEQSPFSKQTSTTSFKPFSLDHVQLIGVRRHLQHRHQGLKAANTVLTCPFCPADHQLWPSTEDTKIRLCGYK